MNLSDVRKKLLSEIVPFFGEQGFTFVARRQAMCRKFDLGEQCLHLRLISVGGVHRLELSASIRFDEVEQIYHRTSGVQEKFRKDTFTLWIACESISGWSSTECHRRIASPTDLDAAAQAVRRFYEDHAIGYFESHSTLRAAEEALNASAQEASPHCAQPARSYYGAILAALTNRGNFERIAAEHRKVLAGIDNGFHLSQFDALTEDLRTSIVD